MDKFIFFALDCFTNFLLHSRFDQNQNHTRGSFSFKTREAVNPFKSGPLIEKVNSWEFELERALLGL